MEYKRIATTRVDRYRVYEVAVALLCVEIWIRSAVNQSRRIGKYTTLKIVIGMPQVSTLVCHCRALHDKANGELLMGQARQNLKSIQRRRSPIHNEIEMKNTILVWIDVLEDALVSDIGSKSIQTDVECFQKRCPVGTYLEKTTFWIILQRSHELQKQFIGPRC